AVASALPNPQAAHSPHTFRTNKGPPQTSASSPARCNDLFWPKTQPAKRLMSAPDKSAMTGITSQTNPPDTTPASGTDHPDLSFLQQMHSLHLSKISIP